MISSTILNEAHYRKIVTLKLHLTNPLLLLVLGWRDPFLVARALCMYPLGLVMPIRSVRLLIVHQEGR
jgi:hypothetical protein